MRFKNYEALKIEPEIMNFWNNNSIYKKAKDKNKGKQKFYFLDGPPYTSGKVHIGTAWNKSLKDSILRYKRMVGFDVWDRAGYDMHGLPTENATQKKLGLKTKLDIENFGRDKFIEECKTLCVENMKVMNEDFKRMGVWMDFDNAYQSVDKDFMQGEWWLIKRAHEEGRLYQGLRTMTWCANTESALAKHELEYKTVTDDSIFVKMKIKDKEDEYLIIWTTTPWTIPFNLAIMINPEVDYVKAKVEDEVWYVAQPLANVFISSVADKKYEVLDTVKGESLEGIEYTHPFYEELKHIYDPIKKESKKTHTVLLSSEYVDTSGGSGLVHCAPGCGPEDYEVGHANGIPPFNNIDPKGVFPEDMGKFAGLRAKKDDKKFIEALKDCGALIASTPVEHEYPHDWRYHEPVIFRTTKQWFFKVEDMKDDMIKENNDISWVPKAAYNAFDSWLKNLRDNSISKQRYWGTPVPIWQNVDDETDYIVIGSIEELKELSGQEPDDLHIPSVDPIVINKDDKTYKRVSDILDVWVDAGTVSWNCLYYPKQKELFDNLFPADFILEGKDQIRGWFNLLHVASMISMKRPSFKNVYMHGFINDAQGRKMSKSLGNYILPLEVIEKYGADTLRYYMIGGANPGLDLNYNHDDAQLKHKNLMVLWNIHKFIIDLAFTINKNPKDFTEDIQSNFSLEEDYIISRLNTTIMQVTELFEEYRLNEVPLRIEELFLDISRTYIQLIRDKASIGSDEEKEVVLYTLYTSIMECLKIFSPVAPYITEQIYQNLKDEFSLETESIHLFDWPKHDVSKIHSEMESQMDIASSIIQSALYCREKIGQSLRWPLKELTVIPKDDAVKVAVQKLMPIILNQTNIKEVIVKEEMQGVEKSCKPNFKKLGELCGQKVPQVSQAIKDGDHEAIINSIEKDGFFKVAVDGSEFDLTKDHIIIQTSDPKGYVGAESRFGDVYLSQDITPELIGEGYAREIMRKIQNMRKQEGLEKNDEVNIFIKTDKDTVDMLSGLLESIKTKCGIAELNISDKEPAHKHSIGAVENIRKKDFSIFMDIIK